MCLCMHSLYALPIISHSCIALWTQREYLELWKLLHDLVLVVLADFAVDPDEMRRLNARDELDATLYDYEAQRP